MAERERVKKYLKIKKPRKFTREGVSIKIHEINVLEDHVSLYAQAWRGTEQLGFGKDGSVDIERFRFFNVPSLVEDKNGDVEREIFEVDFDEDGEDIKVSKKIYFREDRDEALKQILKEAVRTVGKDGKNITKGKVGNTVSTFYPVSAGEGIVQQYNTTTNWATCRGASTGNGVQTSNTTDVINFLRRDVSGTRFGLKRFFFPFDTSSIPDTDGIDSAVLSFYLQSISGSGIEVGIGIIAPTTQASTSTLENDDYVDCGDLDTPQEVATRPSPYDWSTSAYNDITLNATGEGQISKTGVTKLGVRNVYDIDDTLIGSGSRSDYLTVRMSDYSGTTSDPKLVVEHSGASSTFVPTMQII